MAENRPCPYCSIIPEVYFDDAFRVQERCGCTYHSEMMALMGFPKPITKSDRQKQHAENRPANNPTNV